MFRISKSLFYPEVCKFTLRIYLLSNIQWFYHYLDKEARRMLLTLSILWFSRLEYLATVKLKELFLLVFFMVMKLETKCKINFTFVEIWSSTTEWTFSYSILMYIYIYIYTFYLFIYFFSSYNRWKYVRYSVLISHQPGW